ncbi:YciI family protein [Saccharopolyspora halophila]|uniref:YciI family protein n=1 Tax=Saccharopolyspora halophila TaxID=405551 RepID=A0ABN3FRE0_9PSEU
MPRFVFDMVYGDDEDKRLAVRPEHREYAKGLAERGKLLAGGPFADGKGAQIVYEAADEAELDELIANDPYTKAGVLASTSVRQWEVVTGAWL